MEAIWPDSNTKACLTAETLQDMAMEISDRKTLLHMLPSAALPVAAALVDVP